MSAEKLPPERRPPASAADAASRLATIVDAAERAAASVIDDAEAQAQRHLEEAHGRADRIVAERLRELADQLDPPGSGDRQAIHLKPVETAGEMDETSDDALPPQGQRRSGSAGARLLATQMAVSGASRKEIEARLRNGFDIENTSEILDAILGSEE
jgi:cell division septum initiation protein DivIVA